MFTKAAAAQAAIPTDEAGFTRHVAERIRREVGDAPVSVKGPLTLSVGPLQANLDRIFALCGATPAACAGELDTFAEGLAETLRLSSAPLEKVSLRFVIRDTEYLRRAQDSFGVVGSALQTRPLVDGLALVAVADTPRTLEYVDERQLRSLGLSQEVLFTLARANTEAELRPLAAMARPVLPGQIGSITGTVYEVSRVALHGQWAGLAQAQKGTLVVAIPTTDLVLYAAEATPKAMDALRTLARHIMAKASNPLSDVVLCWTPTGWTPAK
jgi:hypothetical protein